MGKHKGIIAVLLALIFSVLVCLLLYNFDNKYKSDSNQPISGVLFLSAEDLATKPVRFLTKEWEIFPNVLLTPKEAQNYQGYRRYTNIGGKNGMNHGSSTYRLTLMLPQTQENYALELPEVFSSCRLYINDKLMFSLGNPYQDNFKEGIGSRVIPFKAEGKTQILLAVSDHNGVYSGLNYPPAFGETQAILQMRELRLLLHAGAVLLSLLGASLAVGFGLRGNRRRGILCFLLCLCLVPVVGYPLIHALFITGFQPWYTIEISCYYALLLLAVLMQCELYGIWGKWSYLLASPCMLGLVTSLVRVIGAGYLGTKFGIAFSMLSFFLKCYSAICLIGMSLWAVKKGKKYSIHLLSGSVILSVCLFFDRAFPLYEPIFGGWFYEIGGCILIATLGVALWLDALEAYRFRLNYEVSYIQMENRLNMQKEHYQQLAEQIKLSRYAAHDLRHHIRILRSIASDGQLDRLNSYLDSYEPHLADREITVWSDNPVADAVIGHYASVAKALNAVYDVKLPIPSDLIFPDDELCILLSNLLENATEAIARQKYGNKQIYLRGNVENGRLGIVLDNSFDGTLKVRNEEYISTKHDGFGIGLSSVRAIAQKYGGLADFAVTDNTFHSSIMVPIHTKLP